MVRLCQISACRSYYHNRTEARSDVLQPKAEGIRHRLLMTTTMVVVVRRGRSSRIVMFRLRRENVCLTW